MKKVKNLLKRIKRNIVKYSSTNRLFLTYVILSIIGTIILRNVTVNGHFIIRPFIVDLAWILIIGSFGYLLKPKNQYKYFFIWLIIFTTIEIINSIYYTFYISFASILDLTTLHQAETVVDAIWAKLRLVDFIYLFQPILFYYIHNNLKKSSYYNIMVKIEKGKKMALSTFIVGIVLLGINFIIMTRTDYSRLNKLWNRSYIVDRFGIIMYHFNDLFQAIKPKLSSIFGAEDAKELFVTYFENQEKYNNKNKYTGILEGYNIVYIHMESIQNFLMDLKFNGVEVAPNLKKIAKEGLFFSNFYSPVSIGTSSDAEYMMLSGLLPTLNGTVFATFPNNTFRTLPKFLQNRDYYTFSMHGNYASMWNRSKVHPKLGYEGMYYRDSYNFTEEDIIGLGINDKLFFKQSIAKLENIESEHKNYFGTVITLSNHSPFKHNDLFTLDLNDYFIDEKTNLKTSTCYLCNRDIGKYLASSHYADEALGEFLNYLKESNYFNNTLFVFYGDHDAKISYKDMNYLYNYNYQTGELKTPKDEGYIHFDSYDYFLNKKVPLIMWTKNKTLARKLKGENKTLMAMYDVAPTLFNMLNIKNDYTLGHDIYNIKNKNIVIFPNGNYLTDKVYYNNSTGEYKILKKDVILDSDYINKNLDYANLTLDVANAIIVYDLFNEDKGIDLK